MESAVLAGACIIALAHILSPLVYRSKIRDAEMDRAMWFHRCQRFGDALVNVRSARSLAEAQTIARSAIEVTECDDDGRAVSRRYLHT